jgi:uncharacterized membrane protein YphA (DoxX/SURF4 family)
MDFLVSDGFRTAIHVVGRVLFSMMFIMSGMNHLMKLNDMSAYAESKGVPAPKVLTAVSGLMIMVGGVLVLIGWHRFIGAGLIAVFLLPTAMQMHAFWKETDPAARMNEMAHFMKDMAMAGAALLIAFYSGTVWPISLG